MGDTVLGPIDYLAVEWPGRHVTGEGFRLLMDLVDREITIQRMGLLRVSSASWTTSVALSSQRLEFDISSVVTAQTRRQGDLERAGSFFARKPFVRVILVPWYQSRGFRQGCASRLAC